MPTYTLTSSNINLNPKKQEEIAKGITKIHNAVSYTHLRAHET